MLWIHADTPADQRAAANVASVAGALLSALAGEQISATPLDTAPDLAWWQVSSAETRAEPAAGANPAPVADSHGFELGLDLNAWRRAHPEHFADQRLNEALHGLGLANARGLVLTVGGPDSTEPRQAASAQLTVSFRNWDVDASLAIPLSLANAAAGPDRVAIRPRWGDWIDRVIASHRAMLDPLRRSPFDAEFASWQRRHEQKVRQATASLEGPILMGGVESQAYALVGIGARADTGLLLRNLSIILAPIGPVEFDAQSGVGRITVPTLAETEFASLEWRVFADSRRAWLLVTRDGAGDQVSAALEP